MDLEIVLYPKQREFYEKIEDHLETLYGGAKGGGKSGGMRRVLLLRRFKYPGSTGALFRRTYEEIYGNHIKKLFEEYPELRQFWSEQHNTLNLPNGSSLKFAFCQYEKDLAKHQGQEYNDLAIEEAGEWPESMYSTLKGSNRSSVVGIKPRILLSGNPGGIGHGWLKRLFVDRKYKGLERPSDYAFIQAKVEDNPALWDNDPDYVRKLDSNPNEALRKAYRDGDWNIFAGQFFQDLSRETHIVPDFTPPAHHIKFGAYDYGYNHPAVFGWFCVDGDGNVTLYKLLAKAQMYVETFARECLKLEPDTKDLAVFAGEDCWAKKAVMKEKNPPTVAEEFAANGIPGLRRAITDRIPGASHVRSYLQLRDGPKGNPLPRFRMTQSCAQAFECLVRMIHDPNRVEDVLKVDASNGDPDTGDDIYDMLRYGLMSRPPLADAPKITHPYGSKEHSDEVAQELFRHLQEKQKLAKEAKDGVGITWQTDSNMTPPWNQW